MLDRSSYLLILDDRSPKVNHVQESHRMQRRNIDVILVTAAKRPQETVRKKEKLIVRFIVERGLFW